MNETTRNTRLTRLTRLARLTRLTRPAGFTLVELLVVMAIIAVMAMLVLPGFTRMISSNKEGAALNLIRAALVEAQVHAAQTQKYAGIRFQFDKNGWADGRQYLVLIENITGDEYRAAPNAKPTALPEGIGVIDYSMLVQYPVNQSQIDNNNYNLSDNDTNQYGLLGSTTFSILFSPTGQLVVKNLHIYRWDEYDQVFNNQALVEAIPIKGQLPPPLLYYDNNNPPSWGTKITNSALWCWYEPSAKGFYFFEVNKMLQDVNPGTRWSDYIGTVEVEPVLINMYTGTILRGGYE